jgi:hypothetical protein
MMGFTFYLLKNQPSSEPGFNESFRSRSPLVRNGRDNADVGRMYAPERVEIKPDKEPDLKRHV